MELLSHKCVVLAVLVCVRLCAGLCPLVICRQGKETAPWAVLVLALGYSLAGGVLLATVFLHMMPEAVLVLALGYSLAGGVLLATVFLHMMPEVRLLMHHFLPDHRLPVTELLVTAGFLLTFLLDEMIINLRSSSRVSPTPTPSKDPEDDASQSQSPSRASSAAASFPLLPRGVLLSLHAVGQGAAVGLADTAPSTWLMAAAAGAAGSMDSVSHSARLLASGQSPKVVTAFCVVVTFVMTMGMVAGTLLWYLGVEGAILAILRGIATGNLLYQAVYELLTREVRERAMGLLSLFVCLLGFLIILILQLIDIGLNKSLGHQYTEEGNPLIEPIEEPDYENYPDDDQ